jgi:hypothetical protein
MKHQKVQLTGALCFLLTCVCSSAAQRTDRGETPPVKVSAQQKTPGPDDSWWSAQRNIETAINQLEKYLRETPDGSHAPTARQQLAALRSLSVTQLKPEWAPMRSLSLPDVPLWRVGRVEQFVDRTRIVLEMKCASEREDCSLKPFQKYPLILLAAGDLYPMLEAGPLPTDIRYARDGTALLAAGRTVSVIVDFAPLQPVAGGRVQFRDDNDATPAKFSLIRKP